ncbi:MAG: lactate utilization protein [Coxiella sp. (in: Bacteria)]|nr:MAG: lactate utilization protein [Coxiella sp. (in: g-proteobacteria)]
MITSTQTLLDEFIDKATHAHVTVHRVDDFHKIPQLIGTLVDADSTIVSAKTQPLTQLDWGQHTISDDIMASNDGISLTEAHCGIAETGTLMMCSSATSPTSLNFLPLIQFVCLDTTKIVATYEDAWQRVNQQGRLPRCVNFITGPSCTGDIEQEILWGAHGPKTLHLILYQHQESL